MAHEIQERSFCSHLWSATCQEAKFRWKNEKTSLYLFALGIIIYTSFILMLSHPSFAMCTNWSYCATNPSIIFLSLGVAGTAIPLVGYLGHIVSRIYQRTMHPESFFEEVSTPFIISDL